LFAETDDFLAQVTKKSLKPDECSCGIAAILESRSLKGNLSTHPVPQLSLSMFGVSFNFKNFLIT